MEWKYTFFVGTIFNCVCVLLAKKRRRKRDKDAFLSRGPLRNSMHLQFNKTRRCVCEGEVGV